MEMENAFVLDLLCGYDSEVLEIYLDDDDGVALADAFAALDEDRVRQYPSSQQQRSLPDLAFDGRFANWACLALTNDELDEVLRLLNSDDGGDSESKAAGLVLDDSLGAVDSDEASGRSLAPRCEPLLWQGRACKLLDATPVQPTTLLRPTPLSWSSTEDWISTSVDACTVWCTPALLSSDPYGDSRCQYGRCSRAAVVLDWCLAHADLLFSSHNSQQQTQAWPSSPVQAQQQQQMQPVSIKKRYKRRRAVFGTAKKRKQRKLSTPSAPRSAKPSSRPKQQHTGASETTPRVSVAGLAQYSTIRTRRNRRISFGVDDEDDELLEIAL